MNERDLLAGLAAVVGEANLLTGAAMAPFLTDWRGRYHGSARCVVRPAGRDELAAVVGRCAAARVAMVPQGGNSGLCGGATPDAGGAAVLISLQRLRQIRAVDAANNTITAEAGCTLSAVQEAARQAGRLFPLSLASEGSAQIGGNLSTNAGGVHVLRYGSARSLALGLEVVLPSGEIWHGLRGLRKDNCGYDLKQLFIGAEGTLGIISAATLRLFPLPPSRATAWLAIDSPAAALALFHAASAEFGEALNACELISGPTLDLVLRHMPGSRAPLAAAPWHLLIELAGRADLAASLENWLAGQLAAGGCSDALLATSLAQAGRLWALRDNISAAQKSEGVSIKHDIALPLAALTDFLAAAEAALQQAFPGVRQIIFGHVGDGNLHYNLSQPDPAANRAFIERQPQVNRVVYDLVAAFGGSISAEHGIGQLKRAELRRHRPALEIDLMQSIKRTLDPHGLMNPGKVL